MQRPMYWLRGLVAQAEVVHALVFRETRTRFGAHQLGYLWALLEPALMILTFFILFQVAGRVAPDEMDLFGFIATGVIPYLAFRNGTERVAVAITSNKALLFYPKVQPLDLVLARGALEAATFAGVFILLLGGNALYRQEIAFDDPLLLIIGFALASLFGTALGLVLCTLGQLSNAVDRARGPLLRPMFWISGLFFTANALPGEVREPLLGNPLMHTIELVRDGWYPNYTAGYASISYVLAWILALSVIGLTLERVVRRRIEVT